MHGRLPAHDHRVSQRSGDEVTRRVIERSPKVLMMGDSGGGLYYF